MELGGDVPPPIRLAEIRAVAIFGFTALLVRSRRPSPQKRLARQLY